MVFYSIWSWKYFLLLVLSIAFNYSIGLKILKSKHSLKKLILVSGVSFNLLLLAYFKYYNFFLENINNILSLELNLKSIILPLAISFYTFQQIAFLLDCNKQKIKNISFIDYFFFITFFPQLIAGPIVHHQEIIPNVKNIKVNFSTLSYGLSYFALGMFKKLIIADTMAEYADPIFLTFSRGNTVGFFSAWIGILSYSFQIYFDFSGYSDMAIGLGKIFNLDLPINFNSPYKSVNIIEFWRRWHITLSRFLRDYLYIPLGGNRKGNTKRYLNLFITMLLGGLWHGSSWNFVIWGALHGVYLFLCHFFRILNIRVTKLISIPSTFIAVMFAWIFFRSINFNASIEFIKSLIGLNGFTVINKYLFLQKIFDFIQPGASSLIMRGNTQILNIILAAIICFYAPNTQEIMQNIQNKKHFWNFNLASALVISIILAIAILNMNQVNEFIYFQF